MKKTCILIVDDEPDNFDALETLLSVSEAFRGKEQDYQLQYSASGQHAISTLDTFNPDLILLDMMMPGMDGIEVCQKIKAMPQWRSVPIIMVTALTSKKDLARSLKSGADDFISKPVNSLELGARVQSMLRIKHQYDNLQTLLKQREDMVNMVVHDLRNPLSSVLFGLELLNSSEYPKEKQKQKLAQIYSSAQGLQVLIDDLLQIASLESGKLRLSPVEIDPCNLIESAVSGFQAIVAQKNQSLVSKLPEESSRKISVDTNMMRRTLDNLLSNAIKFSPRHSQITVQAEFLSSGDCKIQVIDSGPGVPDELQQKIFEKYEIGSLMPGIPQIGLGLAFCKMSVEAHGGDISVRNNQPKGAIFEIILAG